MDIRSLYDSRSPYTVREALEKVIDGSDYERGQIETLEETVANQTRVITVLVEVLLDAQALSKEDLFSKVLNGEFKEVENEAGA